MPLVRITPKAEESIYDLWDWGRDYHGEQQADNFIDELHRKFEDIARMPYASTARPKLGEGVRSRPFKRYTIFSSPKIRAYWLYVSMKEAVNSDSFSITIRLTINISLRACLSQTLGFGAKPH